MKRTRYQGKNIPSNKCVVSNPLNCWSTTDGFDAYQDECSELVVREVKGTVDLHVRINQVPFAARELEPGVSTAMVDWALRRIQQNFEQDRLALECDEDDQRPGGGDPRPDPDSDPDSPQTDDPKALTGFLSSLESYYNTVEDCVNDENERPDMDFENNSKVLTRLLTCLSKLDSEMF